MAELTNKFHVKSGDTVHECVCYTLQDEATPKTVQGATGSIWEIKNNGVVCYLGLWPATATNTSEYSTPLTIKKNNVEYYVQSKVLNYFTVTINQTEHQTIQVSYNGQKYTSSFQALAGSQIGVFVFSEEGYLSGNVLINGVPSTGSYVNSDLTITASPASKATYLVTIQQSANQTISVVCNGNIYTSNFTANYGDTYTATIKANEGYNAGQLSTTSGTITGPLTISATAASIVLCTLTVTQPDNGRIEVNGQVGTSFALNYGTNVKLEAIANDGYVVEALYLDEV